MALLSAKQVANYCGVPQRTVQSWMQSGRLPNAGEQAVTSADLIDFMHHNHLAIPAALLDDQNAPGDSNQPRVLVVDEDRPMAQAIARVIRQMGFDVVQFDNGSDANDTLALQQPALVSLDLPMQGMDGLALIASIKSTHPQTRILVISGAIPSTLAKAKEAGADAVLNKPFDNDSLRRVIRIMLEC